MYDNNEKCIKEQIIPGVCSCKVGDRTVIIDYRESHRELNLSLLFSKVIPSTSTSLNPRGISYQTIDDNEFLDVVFDYGSVDKVHGFMSLDKDDTFTFAPYLYSERMMEGVWIDNDMLDPYDFCVDFVSSDLASHIVATRNEWAKKAMFSKAKKLYLERIK